MQTASQLQSGSKFGAHTATERDLIDLSDLVTPSTSEEHGEAQISDSSSESNGFCQEQAARAAAQAAVLQAKISALSPSRSRSRGRNLSAGTTLSDYRRKNSTASRSSLKLVSGLKSNHRDATHAARVIYSLDKYSQPYIKTFADPAQFTGTHAAPLSALANKPWNALHAEQIPTSVGSLAADTTIGMLLGPLSLFATQSSIRAAVSAAGDRKSVKQRLQALDEREASIKAETPALSEHGKALADAELNTITTQRESLKKSKSLLRERLWENISSAVSAGAFSIKTLLGIGVKAAAIFSGKGAALAGSAGGAGAVGILGALGSFGLGPIAAIALTIESVFLLRKSRKMKRDFKDAAPEAAAHLKAAAAALGEGEAADDVKGYQAFVERKLGLREKFFRRFKNMNRLRVVACAFFSATVLTKLGLGVAALAVGGFALSNPVGWALFGLGLGAAVIVTVGAFVFTYSRRSARYEQYQRDDAPEIDREFLQAVESIEAIKAKSQASESPSIAPRELPQQTRSKPAAARLEQAQKPAAPAWNGATRGRTSSPTTARQPSPQSRSPEREEQRPLLNSIDFSSSSPQVTDDDDEDADNSSPAICPIAPPTTGLGLRARTFASFNQRGEAHASLVKSLSFSHNKAEKLGVRTFFKNLFARMTASFHWSGRLVASRSFNEARKTFRSEFSKRSARLTVDHFKHAIVRGDSRWQRFVTQHLDAESKALEHKSRVRNSFNERSSDVDSSISRNKAQDTQRSATIAVVRSMIDDGETSQEDINRAFLTLIHDRGEPEELSDDEVAEALAIAMKKHYGRRVQDLKNMLVQSELDCAVARRDAV